MNEHSVGLFRPGEDRAGALLSDAALVAALLAVEEAWLAQLVAAGVAPASARAELGDLVGPGDLPALGRAAEAGGNVVIPLVELLRERLDGEPGRWAHRGLTSQDVLDTALVLCLRDTAGAISADTHRQVVALIRLAETHRDDVQAARTLGQHAVPTTFGAVAAGWLAGILDAVGDLRVATTALPVQAGGAAGTRAALDLLAGADSAAVVEGFARRLELPAAAPWHTNRRPFTRVGDALVACTDSWGKIAGDVVLRSRPELGELAEGGGPGRGGSSTMPHKHNPVLATLIRRSALSAPSAAAELHLCAVHAADERSAGAWHAEWPALRRLGREAAIAASLTADLLEGLEVDVERMRRTADEASGALLAEQHSLAPMVGAAPAKEPVDFLGAAGRLVDEAIERARAWLEGY